LVAFLNNILELVTAIVIQYLLLIKIKEGKQFTFLKAL
jgi:hypothetical protein